MTQQIDPPRPHDLAEVRPLALEAVVRRIGQVVRDKDDVVRLMLIGVLARGHILLEDVPGVGKTTLARALALLNGRHLENHPGAARQGR
jgi:MoxR-like ATPase